MDRHTKRKHDGQSFNFTLCGKTCTRSKNLEMHMRTWPAAPVASTSSSSTLAYRGGAAFTVRGRRRAFGGAAEMHTVDMQEANQLVVLEEAVLSLEPTH